MRYPSASIGRHKWYILGTQTHILIWVPNVYHLCLQKFRARSNVNFGGESVDVFALVRSCPRVEASTNQNLASGTHTLARWHPRKNERCFCEKKLENVRKYFVVLFTNTTLFFFQSYVPPEFYDANSTDVGALGGNYQAALKPEQRGLNLSGD